MYLDHLKFCVVCIDGRRYVCCSECNVVYNECNEPTSCLMQPISTHNGEVMYFGCVCFRGELGFLNCDDICICVLNMQFQLVYGSARLSYIKRLDTILNQGLRLCLGAFRTSPLQSLYVEENDTSVLAMLCET